MEKIEKRKICGVCGMRLGRKKVSYLKKKLRKHIIYRSEKIKNSQMFSILDRLGLGKIEIKLGNDFWICDECYETFKMMGYVIK